MATAFGEVNVANETPLMFSRSSSLGSLSSLDQQAALNVHNLAVSHSQHTSGAVSPSDLPDSPSQTMPPSPRGRSPVFRLPPCTKPIPQPVGGVFQDYPRSFAEEGTPCRISQATSLSSLTLDDDASGIEKLLGRRDGHEAFGGYKKEFSESPFYARDHHGQERARAPSCRVAGISEVAEEVFADTTRRYAQEGTPCGYSRAESPCSLINDSSFPQSGVGSDWEDDFEVRPNQSKQPALFGSGRGRRWSGERSKSHVTHKHVSFNDDCVMRTSHEDTAVPYFADDCVRVYCTEGTPSVLSHAPSLNDLGSTKAWASPPGPTEHVLEGSPEVHQTAAQHDGQSDAKRGHKHVSFDDDCHLGSPHEAVSPSFEEDCLRVYCTEDTPSVLSHSASFTDLSIGHDESKSWAEQSPKPPCIKAEALIDVSDEEEGSADLIKQCIQLGWQVTQSSHPKTRSWSGAPEESIIINAPIPKPRSLIGAAGGTVTGQSCLPSSHVLCPSRLQAGNQDGVHIDASPLKFKGTSSGKSSSSGNLVAESSLQPTTLGWKSSSFSDIAEPNSHQGGSSKDVCKCTGDQEFDTDGCAAVSDSARGGLTQERPLCQESSDEEDDVQLLQEVVMMGRALVGKPELLSAATPPSTNFPDVLPRTKLCPHCPPSDAGLGPVTSPPRAPHCVMGTRCSTASGSTSAKEQHPVEQMPPAHSSDPESVACTLPIKDACVSESSDEEQDSKILLEVISLGRAMVGKQHHGRGKGTKLVGEEPQDKVRSYQSEKSPVLFADGCRAGVFSAPDMFATSDHCLGNNIVPNANDCLMQDDDDDDDNEDDEKLLKEVVMLGLSSMQTMALKLPQLDKKPETMTIEGTPAKANPVAVLVTEEVARAEKIEEVSSRTYEEISAIVPEAAADLKEEHKAKPAVPPEPPADSLDRVVQIRLKLPNGRSLTRRFLASAELGVLLVYLDSLGYPLTRFKIIKNWRRQELATVNPKQTLEQLKLYPKKTLTIKER